MIYWLQLKESGAFRVEVFMERVSKENYYLDIAQTVSERATCLRRRFGAIIVKNDVIVSTGYNGAPRGRQNCCDLNFCYRDKMQIPRGERYELCRSVHAEQNAICQAAYYGHATAGATIYVTISPCMTCAKLIINSGIKEVVYGGDYPYLDTVKRMFRESGVKCRRFK